MNEGFMKKANRKSTNDMCPEYDFASMKKTFGASTSSGIARVHAHALDLELAEAFPRDGAVNQALRLVIDRAEIAGRGEGTHLRRLTPVIALS